MTIIYHPGSPGRPGTPDTVLTLDLTGWGSGSVSVPHVVGTGGYKFKVPFNVVGAVCGLADDYAGIGYNSINHALYFSRGEVSLLRYGSTIESLGSYVSTDEWLLYRAAETVTVYKNGVQVASMPSSLGGEFLLAASLYTAGDTIHDAALAARNSGSGSAILRLKASGMYGTNYGTAEVGPLEATGFTGGHGSGSATMRIEALGADRHYAAGSAKIGPLKAYGESNALAPAWGVGDAMLRGFMAGGHSFTGAVASGGATMHIDVLAADRPYASGGAKIGPLDAFGAEALDISFGLLLYRGKYAVSGHGFEGELSGGQMALPPGSLVGQFGSKIKLTAPTLQLEVEGVFMPVLRGEMTLPALTLDGSGTVGGLLTAEMTLPALGLSGHFGGGGTLAFAGGYTLDASGTAGGVATAALTTQGRYRLEASGTVGTLNVWTLTGPALTAAPSGEAWLVGPALKLYASGGEVVTTTYEAYAINITTGAVTHYTNYPFDNVLRFGNRFFGVKADGLFELSGDTDNGTAIESVIETFRTDFGSSNKKRVPWVYLRGRTGVDLQVSVQADEGPVFSYPVTQTPADSEGGTGAVRATVGRGIKGTYYTFTVANTDGSDFELDRVETIVDVTSRAL